MNTKELTYLLQHPNELQEEHTDQLEKLTKEFPYFQPIKALLLKGLKDQQSFKYNQELKKTAAYTLDRSVLFHFITSTLFNKQKEVAQEKIKEEDIEVIAPQEIKAPAQINLDDAIDMNLQEAEDVLDPFLFATKDPSEVEDDISKKIEITEQLIAKSEENEEEIALPIESEKADEEPSPEETLEIDKPLDFSHKETHSFAEWLKLTSLQPIDRTEKEDQKEIQNEKPQIAQEEEEEETKSTINQKFELIDNFIANNPKIKRPDKSAPNRNMANDHVVKQDELMTETLARVYLAQKKYKNAIQAYKILILKNPEKSGFFADQIKAIKKLQENK